MYKAWTVKAAKQPMVLETANFGPLGAEDVEVAVDHCGLCHSDISILNNDWGISQYPAILGHEVVGRVTAVGPNAKGVQVGQRVGDVMLILRLPSNGEGFLKSGLSCSIVSLF